MRLLHPSGRIAEHAVSSVAQRGLLAVWGVVQTRLLVDDAGRNQRCLQNEECVFTTFLCLDAYDESRRL